MVSLSLSQPENFIDVNPQNNIENFAPRWRSRRFYPPRWARTFNL